MTTQKTFRLLAGFFLLAFIGMNAHGQPVYSTPYAFSTIAGDVNGQAGTNDGINHSAFFNWPKALTVGGNGHVFVADSLNSTIRELVLSGTNWVTTTIAGQAQDYSSSDGTNTDALFNTPGGIAVDANGNLYVADSYNYTIRKITPVETNWVTTTIAGTAGNSGSDDGTNADAQFYYPAGITVGADGNLYVADTGNNIIRQIAPSGTNWIVTTIAGNADNSGGHADGTNGDAQFDSPYQITAAADGALYVADTYNSLIRKISRVGTNWVTVTISGAWPNSSDADGTNTSAEYFQPYSIAADANNNLYVADTDNNTIRKITPDGTNWVTTTLGGVPGDDGNADGTGADALFNFPYGIAADSNGNVYVADTSNNSIRLGVPAAASAPPNLSIVAAAGGVVISWPVAAGYTLQSCGDLTAGNWTNYTGVINAANGTNSVTIASPAGNQFFRLSQ